MQERGSLPGCTMALVVSKVLLRIFEVNRKHSFSLYVIDLSNLCTAELYIFFLGLGL